MQIDATAGTLVPASEALNVDKLIAAFFSKKPDVSVAAQRVSFGTSGHRGCAFDTSFNENHIAAIVQAICDYRASHHIDGPLFLGRDTHAVSGPALQVTQEVLCANGVKTMIDSGNGFTPTPVISHAIITYNLGRTTGLADGIIITPSHNPPEDGGIKYNPPHGGPAETHITSHIESAANDFLRSALNGVKRSTDVASSSFAHDYVRGYTSELSDIVDLNAIREAGVSIGVDPLGGAAVHFWPQIAERYKLNLTVTDSTVDPTFRTIPRDWDGKIRMDCSSKYPMKRLLAVSQKFDIAFANDTDADRHGIVDSSGLMEPNSYLATSAHYLGETREGFAQKVIGKTIVSSSMIDRVARVLGTSVDEMPVGFKWFVPGFRSGATYFAGEESAGSSFLRRNGRVWTTDKDGLIAGLLAAEITAKTGFPPSVYYARLVSELGDTFYSRVDSPATQSIRKKLSSVTPNSVTNDKLAGEPITTRETTASGNGAAIGGIKLSTAHGWIAARPSGTENVFKTYAESFVSQAHLASLQNDARAIVQSL